MSSWSANGLPKVGVASDVVSRRLLGVQQQECNPRAGDGDKNDDHVNLAEAVYSGLMTAQSCLVWACDNVQANSLKIKMATDGSTGALLAKVEQDDQT